MNIYLSNYSPLNSVYTHESGQVLFKVDTPRALGTRISTIRRIIPNDQDRMDRLQTADPTNGEAARAVLQDEDLQDKFEILAQVEHNIVHSSVLKFGGQEIKTSNYFRTDGWGALGRHRVFTGPDGKEYKWHLNMWTCKLTLNDGSKALVAKFHKKSFGVIGKAHPACLEITSEGISILETILVTFIYIEKIRKDKERAAR